MRATAFFLIALGWLLVQPGAGTAQTPEVQVIEVGGLLDDATMRYLLESIDSAAVQHRELAIVQLNSPAVTGSFPLFEQVVEAVADPPLPLVVWLGPAPARAGGGAAQLLASSALAAAAPGTVIENWSPAVVGGDGDLVSPPAGLPSPLVVEGRLEAVVELIVPSVRQLVQELDGAVMTVRGEEQTLATVTEIAGGGVTAIPTTFTQPGLWHRFLHLAARPEAAFFFLVAGLTVAVFEFYAIGPGVAAAVAGTSLLLAGFGLATLPVRWPAVGVAVAAIALFTTAYQRGGQLGLTVAGTALLAWSGLNFASGAPQVETGPVGVALSVMTVLFFYLLAIPTVGRARLSTRTIGRAGLIGQTGRAIVDLTPDGVVEVAGARWPATSHRESGIREGAGVEVVAVSGWQLEVQPAREN